MSLALHQPSAYEQAIDKLLEGLQPDPPPLNVADVGIQPQPGPQEQLVNSRADITIAGGAAGVGKTFGLLLNPLKHKDNGQFGAVIFRRTRPQITGEGAIWDESDKLYPLFAATSNLTELSWRFPSGMSVTFAHMQHAKDRKSWDGSQIACIGFDQLESFEEGQFWYMFSRNRSTCGVRPYILATCNPVPADDPIGGWLNRLIAWWIDQETGYPIASRAGKMRWFVRVDEKLHWGDSATELQRRFSHVPSLEPKSLTFIPGKLEDNKILEAKDPGYRASLMALPYVERERLLGGNWKVRASAGKVFNRAWFLPLVEASPRHARRVRYWDKAGTEGGGKRTSGVLIAEADGVYYIEDIVNGQWSAHNREKVIRATAESDGIGVNVWIEQEPGSGGKESAENTISNLTGYTIRKDKVTGDKITRAGPLSAQAEAGNVKLVRGEWNEMFLTEAHAYEESAKFKDQIDAASGAFNKLALGSASVAVIRATDPPGGGIRPEVAQAEAKRAQRLRESEELRQLRALVKLHGADAVEAIKRLQDPTFVLPPELRS